MAPHNLWAMTLFYAEHCQHCIALMQDDNSSWQNILEKYGKIFLIQSVDVGKLSPFPDIKYVPMIKLVLNDIEYEYNGDYSYENIDNFIQKYFY